MSVLSSSMQSFVAVFTQSIYEFAAMGFIAAVSLHHRNLLCIFRLSKFSYKSHIISIWNRHRIGLHDVYSDGFSFFLSLGGGIFN